MIDVCDIVQLKELLSRHGFHFSKAKGQNFLIKSWVPQRIAEEAGVDESSGVLEVGPGVGPLTQQLCRYAKKVVAVELDTTLKPVLAETMAEFDNLELIFGDVMKTNLENLVAEKFSSLKPMACANLPYYITSPILTKLLESRAFSSVTVMVQKEVAQRICSKAGTSDYSAFTVFCNYYAQPQLLFDVPASCFLPQPKVTSSVITLHLRKEPPAMILDEKLFFRVVRGSFAQRRKMLTNGLHSAIPELSKDEYAQVLVSCGFAPTVRGETLDIAGFAAISNEIYRRLQRV